MEFGLEGAPEPTHPNPQNPKADATSPSIGKVDSISRMCGLESWRYAWSHEESSRLFLFEGSGWRTLSPETRSMPRRP